jgi:MFS family permease
MLTRFCLYGFLKNQRYFEPFFMLALLAQQLSFFWIGMLYACRSLTLNLLEIPSGTLADGWGRRACMIASFLAYVLSFLIFGLAPHWSWFFPAMILFGIGDSFRTGTHKAMIFEWLRLQGRESERTRIYGMTRSWSKFGSALSAILAAIFVLITGNYTTIFLVATIPYLLNIVNFLGYPRELDGETEARPGKGLPAARTVLARTISTLKMVWGSRPLLRLTGESMAWEGVLEAVKDYLQPALVVLVTAATLRTADPTLDPSAVAETGRNPWNVITIGATYSILFLLGGWGSRYAHHFVARCGGEASASLRLWWINVSVYSCLFLFDLVNVQSVVVLSFVALTVLQNVWRPILVSRYDEHADPGRGATVLSIESQAQRLATFVVAPLAGLAIDAASRGSGHSQLWPIGLIGATAALLVIGVSRQGRGSATA